MMMMESMIKSVIDNTLKNDYPHVLLPLAVYARVTKVQDQYTYYDHDIKILDESMNYNEDFPELPRVKSKVRYEVGTIVAVLLMYGQLNAFIVGEAVL
jgi:hypothetical protein